jgi:hypothetical protein
MAGAMDLLVHAGILETKIRAQVDHLHSRIKKVPRLGHRLAGWRTKEYDIQFRRNRPEGVQVYEFDSASQKISVYPLETLVTPRCRKDRPDLAMPKKQSA